MPALEPFYLTDDQIKRLEEMEEDIAFFESELRRAEYVGLDVADIRKRVSDMKATRQKMLEIYKKPKK